MAGPFRVVVTRRGTAWLAEVPEVAGANTFTQDPFELDRCIREAIARALDLPAEAEDTIDVEYYDVDGARRRSEAGPLRAEGPLTPELVSQVARRYLTASGVDLLVGSMRPSIRLTPCGDQPSVGRLGGAAMLDEGQDWPEWDGRRLHAVAVLDLREVPEPREVSLPRDGWLNFFYDAEEQAAWGFDPADRDAWRVVASSSSARPVAVEAALPVIELRAEHEWTLPDAYEDILQPLRMHEEAAFWSVLDELPETRTAHRAGGWPDLMQNPLWLRAQLVSHGIYLGDAAGYSDPRAEALRGGASDWRLLLQIDSEEEAGMMWGDVGRLYFVLTVADLEAGRFENTWFELQCQ